MPIPEINDDEVLVEAKWCGICGSDLHAYRTAVHYPPPTVMGHEYSGVIAKVGKNVTGWKAWHRVTINPGYMCGECYWCRHGFPLQCVNFYDGSYMGKGITREFAEALPSLSGLQFPKGDYTAYPIMYPLKRHL